MIVKYRNYDVYYEVHGQGKPLIILNGIMMSTASWHQFLDGLSDYQVILLDFLDQGRTDDAKDYNHSDQVDLVKCVVDDLNLDEVNIIGVSYGAQIALQYAIKYPVHQMMILNAALYTTPWLSDIGKAWQLSAQAGNPELFYHVTIPYIYSHKFYNEHDEWMKDRKKYLLDVFNEKFFQRMIRLIESSEAYDIRETARRIHADVSVIGAEYDYLTPADETREIAKAIKGSKWHFIKNCGHASMYEQADMFLENLHKHFAI
ncbi:alpha/beta hydrolase [Acidaminobacter sp. JC074]|uniref:alpha/beta fold hydrolase n=1 Tax=Acidaminobacter sp. JC074 TaxID=2530199 RepID=UPI001F1147FC|nr:alpha/beta hydrolase [Acidaminobacter sp. JC074]MCH4886019.1 alpha/beta hydrolase [Acidaminobacter sp. JC074]